MSRHYSKSDVDTHSGGYGSRQYPAINVKVYHFVSIYKVVDKFGCSEDQAERALQFAFDAAQERFWHDFAQEYAEDVFKESVKVYSAGRSSGWLIVDKLPDIETWDAIMLGKWRKFEKGVKREIEYYTSPEYVLDNIEANQWYKDGSEQYNFVDLANGKSACIADLKSQAIEAGYGAVVRA